MIHAEVVQFVACAQSQQQVEGCHGDVKSFTIIADQARHSKDHSSICVYDIVVASQYSCHKCLIHCQQVDHEVHVATNCMATNTVTFAPCINFVAGLCKLH